MPQIIIKDAQVKFDGGIAINTKSGNENSCRFSRNLNIWNDADSITLNPQSLQDDGGIVTGLVKGMVDARPYTTTRFAYDNTGKIYAINPNTNTWSLDHTISIGSPSAQGVGMLADALFYATDTTLGIKKYLSQGGAYNDDFLSDGAQNIDATQSASGQTYTIPSAISETTANQLIFTGAIQLAHDPIKSIAITLSAIGTGDITVTLHDDGNIVMGTATIANASLIVGSNTFTFATPVNIIIGKTYHLHITSTTGTGSVQTKSSGLLSTANFTTYFGILVGGTTYHPIVQHVNGVTGIIAIGNGRYIATYDMMTYIPNKIALEPGYYVRNFAKQDEFIIAYCWKGGNIDNSEYGRAYYWDGIQPYFNYYEDITNGMPNAAINFKNRIFSVLGSRGNINLDNAPYRLIQPAPKLNVGKKVEVLPGAMAIWQDKALFGYSNTDDTLGVAAQNFQGLEPAVYGFGNQSDKAITYMAVSTEVMNHMFQISPTITDPTTVTIGCIYPFGKDLYISWKVGSTYGVDRISTTNNPAQTGSWESLINDLGIDAQGQLDSMPQKQKTARNLVITFAALPVGCTVTPKYRFDRAAAWTYGTATTAGSTRAQLNINTLGAGRYHEIEYGFDLTATVNYPVITGVYYEFDPTPLETALI